MLVYTRIYSYILVYTILAIDIEGVRIPDGGPWSAAPPSLPRTSLVVLPGG